MSRKQSTHRSAAQYQTDSPYQVRADALVDQALAAPTGRFARLLQLGCTVLHNPMGPAGGMRFSSTRQFLHHCSCNVPVLHQARMALLLCSSILCQCLCLCAAQALVLLRHLLCCVTLLGAGRAA